MFSGRLLLLITILYSYLCQCVFLIVFARLHTTRTSSVPLVVSIFVDHQLEILVYSFSHVLLSILTASPFLIRIRLSLFARFYPLMLALGFASRFSCAGALERRSMNSSIPYVGVCTRFYKRTLVVHPMPKLSEGKENLNAMSMQSF